MHGLLLWPGSLVLTCIKTPAVRSICLCCSKVSLGKVGYIHVWPDQSVPPEHVFDSGTLGKLRGKDWQTFPRGTTERLSSIRAVVAVWPFLHACCSLALHEGLCSTMPSCHCRNHNPEARELVSQMGSPNLWAKTDLSSSNFDYLRCLL